MNDISLEDVKNLFEKYMLEKSKVGFFLDYAHELLGSVHNLTSLKSIGDIFSDLIIDSIIPLKGIKLDGRMCDLGSGGGIPGIPISAYYDKNITLVDSINKKTDFLRSMKDKYTLNVDVCTGRIENLSYGEFEGAFDIVVAKALAPLPVLLEYSSRILRKGGRMFFYKGPFFGEELKASGKAMEFFGVELLDRIDYRINGKQERVLAIMKKNKPAIDGYPRRAGLPLKKPIS
jgi:16S rRNA (guanine527-N7)-methyltransferase